jgi:putative ABC transport system permease protein
VADGVLTLTVSLPEYNYPDDSARLRFFEQTIERVERLPGVGSAGWVNVLPFSTYDNGTRLRVDGAPAPEPGREPGVAFRVVSPRYFETLRTPLVEGRSIDARDTADGARVAVVNRALASRYLAEGSSIGRRVRIGSAADAPWLTIVGVVGNVHHSELTERPDPAVYLPMAQAPQTMMMLAIRTDGPPQDLIAAVRAEMRAIDAAQPLYHVKTLRQLVGDSLLPRSTSAALMMLFSALALLLAVVGVYGVVAYGVSQQTREFGLRLALGATPRDLLSLVVRHGLLMIAAGIVLGLAGAFAVSRLLAGALYGISPTDPLTYVAVAGLLVVTGLAACGVPAWRASTVEPVAALRVD